MTKNRLRDLRTSAGMTQEEISEKLNLDKSAICNYELGRRKAPIAVLIKYMEIFNVTMEYLLGIDTLAIKEDSDEFEHFAISKNEIDFIKKLRSNSLIYERLVEDPKRGIEIIERKIG